MLRNNRPLGHGYNPFVDITSPPALVVKVAKIAW